jgi:hypothetical protein
MTPYTEGSIFSTILRSEFSNFKHSILNIFVANFAKKILQNLQQCNLFQSKYSQEIYFSIALKRRLNLPTTMESQPDIAIKKIRKLKLYFV